MPQTRVAVTPLLAVLACAPVGSLGKDLAPETGTSIAASSESSIGPPHSTGTSTGSTSMHDATTDATTDTSTGLHETTSSDSSDSTGAHICPPVVDDDACTMCTKDHCCDDLTACHADPMCLCLHECHLAGTPLPECELMCGTDHGENAALELCMDEQCTPACP